jgi:F0F1-type ATP synthase membrane subunit b/b'
MDQREEKIARRLKEAEDKQREADEAAERHRQAERKLEQERERKVREAEEEAAQRREELVTQAREEADRLRKQWVEGLRDEQSSFEQDMAESLAEGMVGALRRILADLADEELEEAALRAFVERLRALEDDEKQRLAEAVESEDGETRVLSACDLNQEQRQRVADALEELGIREEPEIERREDLVCGLEIRAGGHAVSWHVLHLLDELRDDLMAQVRERVARKES